MSQENIQKTDTPTSESTGSEYNSLEEAIFDGGLGEGSEQTIADVFTTGEQQNATEAPAQTGQPEVASEVETPVQSTDNDQTRYQYWQSQADKVKSENKELKAQIANNAKVQTQPQQSQEKVEAEPEFPPPPAKPLKPAQFSRDEAFSDPSSESARYLDSVEQWRDNMVEYNGVKSEYDSTLLRERFDKQEATRVQNAKRFQAQEQAKKQKNEVYKYVTGHHGLTQDQAVDFIDTMSKPESVNLDNLVQLYRLNNGGAAQQTNPSEPSQEFKQVQNAQQVPSPMGVMPSGQSSSDVRTTEDKIMDTMIGNFNSKNPWK
jgi:hypothetical protein|tara:strand:- start:190 stop:1143 length:954 start_codon:yes stop_codon:yes gene_type:complete